MPFVGSELAYIKDANKRKNICGHGLYIKKCNELIEQYTGVRKVL